jgi:Ca2+/H+ antiporter
MRYADFFANFRRSFLMGFGGLITMIFILSPYFLRIRSIPAAISAIAVTTSQKIGGKINIASASSPQTISTIPTIRAECLLLQRLFFILPPFKIILLQFPQKCDTI